MPTIGSIINDTFLLKLPPLLMYKLKGDKTIYKKF